MYAVQSFDRQVAINLSSCGAVLISLSRLIRAQFRLPNVNMFVNNSNSSKSYFGRIGVRTGIKRALTTMEPWVEHYFYTSMCLYEIRSKVNSVVFQYLTHLIATLTY